MKLRKVTEKQEATYPSFDDYHANRREFMKSLAIGVGGISLTATIGCDGTKSNPDTKLLGEVAPAQAPVQLEGDIAVAKPPRTKGSPKLPGSIPPPEELRLDGEMPAPSPPKKQSISLKGDIAIAKPPLRGKPPSPKPPDEPPPLMGIMKAPEPSPKKEK